MCGWIKLYSAATAGVLCRGVGFEEIKPSRRRRRRHGVLNWLLAATRSTHPKAFSFGVPMMMMLLAGYGWLMGGKGAKERWVFEIFYFQDSGGDGVFYGGETKKREREIETVWEMVKGFVYLFKDVTPPGQ